MGGINHQKWVVYYCYTHIAPKLQLKNHQTSTNINKVHRGHRGEANIQRNIEPLGSTQSGRPKVPVALQEIQHALDGSKANLSNFGVYHRKMVVSCSFVVALWDLYGIYPLAIKHGWLEDHYKWRFQWENH